VKSAFTLLLLLSLAHPATVLPQQRAGEEKGGGVASKPKTRGNEIELLRWKATQALDSLDRGAAEIENVPDRVRVLIEIADALWLVNEDQARSVFTRGFEEVDKLADDSRIDSKRLPEMMRALRRQVIARVARRDPELADRLLRNVAVKTPSVEQRWADTYGSGTPNGAALLSIAQSMLPTDPKQSVALARLAAADGPSQGLRLYLNDLRAKDQAAADSLFEVALAAAAARQPPRLIDALFLWEYEYQPPNFYFGGVSWDREKDAPPYVADARFKRAALLFAVNTIKENAQLLMNPQGAPDNLSRAQASLLYSVTQQILPSIQADLPASAAYLSAVLSNLEGDLRAAGQKIPTPPPTEQTSETPEAGVEKLLESIAKTPRGEGRDDLYLKAAFQLFQTREYDRATQVAEKIDDPARRDMILEPINFNRAGEMISRGKLEEALKAAGDLQSPELRTMMLAGVGRRFLDKGDVARGLQVLGEAQALASKTEPSVSLSSSVLGIALAFDGHDQQRSFEAINQAVEMTTKLKADGGLWVLLSAAGGDAPVSITSLSWKASDNGGLKWVKVKYPTATGLVEVLAKASQRDFDRAMTAAARIVPKGLSLAVQAAVCRAAIESTRGKAVPRRS
jgi:hypothetical protein